MKLFDATPSLINAVKDVMEKKMTKDELAAMGGDKRKVDAEDFEALRNGEHKKKHKKKHHVKEEETLDERNKENKFKKDLYVAKKGVEHATKNWGFAPKDHASMSRAFGHDKPTERDNMKSLLKDYKRRGRAMTKGETEVVEGSTWGVDSPKRKKGQYASDDGRHIAKVHKKEDEYVVSIHSDGKHNAKADYFTDDKEDAHDTAKAMLAHAVKHAKPLKEASEIEEGKKEYTVYKMDKNNTVISIGSSEASRRHAMKLSNIGGKKFHKGQASGAVVVTKKDGKVQKVRPSHSKLVEETDKKKKAYQDGGNFYDEKSGKLLASHEDMVKGDYDIRGAKKAREHFNKNSKTHVCEEVETSLVSKIINKYTK